MASVNVRILLGEASNNLPKATFGDENTAFERCDGKMFFVFLLLVLH
jgi:hypothetical protein